MFHELFAYYLTKNDLRYFNEGDKLFITLYDERVEFFFFLLDTTKLWLFN